MGITTSARSLARHTSDRYANIGRVDRLMRVCLTLSLLMLGGFSMAMASRSTLSGVIFCLAGLYCLATAALGSDPIYRRAGIDTRDAVAQEAPADRDDSHDAVLSGLTHSGDLVG